MLSGVLHRFAAAVALLTAQGAASAITYVQLHTFKDSACSQESGKQFVELGACLYRQAEDSTYMYTADQSGTLTYFWWQGAVECNRSTAQGTLPLTVGSCNAQLMLTVDSAIVPAHSQLLTSSNIVRASFITFDSPETCEGNAPLFEVFQAQYCYFRESDWNVVLYSCAGNGSAVSVQVFGSLGDCMSSLTPVTTTIQGSDTCVDDVELLLCGGEALRSPVFTVSSSPFSAPASSTTVTKAPSTTTRSAARLSDVQYVQLDRFQDQACARQYNEEFVELGACIQAPNGHSEMFVLNPSLTFYSWSNGTGCSGPPSINTSGTLIQQSGCTNTFSLQNPDVAPYSQALAANQVLSMIFDAADGCEGDVLRFEVFQTEQCYFLEDGATVRQYTCTADGAVLLEVFSSLTACMSQGPPQQSTLLSPNTCQDNQQVVLCGANAFNNPIFTEVMSPFRALPRRA